MKKFYWFSSEKMTFGVETEENFIKTTAPIANKFRGQHIDNLMNWFKKQPGSIIKEI